MKRMTNYQWDRLKMLDKILPGFLKEIQDSPVTINEWRYNEELHKMEVSENYHIDYKDFLFNVKSYHDNAYKEFSLMIKLGDPFKKDSFTNCIYFDNNTGEFTYKGIRSIDPIQLVSIWVRSIHEQLIVDPINDFDQQYESNECGDYMSNLIENYLPLYEQIS